MFLAYGAAVICIIVWAARSDKGRSLKFLLSIVAIGVAVLAWLTLPRAKPTDVPYTVLVTVVSPDNLPVTDAHVTSNRGGEALKRDGGWNITLPSTEKGQSLTIYAEVEDRGWNGNIEQPLGDNHSPTVTVALKETGELPVRGTVKHNGAFVPNALVSIQGYEAKLTNASGQFVLASHAAKDQAVHLHAELAPNLVADIPDYKVGSAPAELNLQPIGESGLRKPKPVKPHPTGDVVIDRVIANLYTLEHAQNSPTEAQLAGTLAPLFSRPAFYTTRQQDWGYFLYPLCRTRLLLEQYEGDFKSNPAVRQNIADAVARMVQLQNDVAGLYGPNFRIEDQIHTYINDSKKFVQNLPSLAVTPSADFYEARDRQIKEIRRSLQTAGLLENP
jgi:hypothetical protein